MSIAEQVGKTSKPEEIAELVTGDLFLIKANIGSPMQMLNTFRMRHEEQLRYNPQNIAKGLLFYETYYDARTDTRHGHWAGLALKGREAYFFDSLGIFPDDQLNKISTSRLMGNHNRRHIAMVLHDLMQRGYKIHYNPNKLQEDVPAVSTCGRYVALFLEEAIKQKDPYAYMKQALDPFKRKGENFYDEAIVRYSLKD
jgi:hypothetical protein